MCMRKLRLLKSVEKTLKSRSIFYQYYCTNKCYFINYRSISLLFIYKGKSQRKLLFKEMVWLEACF